MIMVLGDSHLLFRFSLILLYLIAMVKMSRIKQKQNKSPIKINFRDVSQREKLQISMIVLIDGFKLILISLPRYIQMFVKLSYWSTELLKYLVELEKD